MSINNFYNFKTLDPKPKASFYDFQNKIIIIIDVHANTDTSDAHNSALARLRGERTAAAGTGLGRIMGIAGGSAWTTVENGGVARDARGDGRSARCMLFGGQHCLARIGPAASVAAQGLVALTEDWNQPWANVEVRVQSTCYWNWNSRH